MSDTAATAYHEAGHALAYVHQGRELTEVSVIGTTGHRGITRVVPRLTTGYKFAVVSALGPLTQAEYTWRTDDYAYFLDCLDDAISDGGHDDVRDSLGLLYNDSFLDTHRYVLAKNWASVERLALALIERGTVPGAEAAGMLQ